MQNNDEKNNLSKIGIYDLMKVKNPKRFHLEESAKSIYKAIELIKIAKRDLVSTPFGRKKQINKSIVKEIEKQLNNVCWNLLPLGEAISKLESIKQNAGTLTEKALLELFDYIRNGGEDII